MKRTYLLLGALVFALPLSAQDIYKVESFSSEDLNGTARYVGMGGAMNALGADISTMSVNPAGIGLYRRSDFSMTGSFLMEKGAKRFNDIGKNRASFDQIGFVWSTPTRGNSLKFMNFGFNYRKSKNLKNYIGIENVSTNGASQAISAANLGYMYGGDYYTQNSNGSLSFKMPLTDAAYNSYMLEPTFKTGSTTAVKSWIPTSANAYNYRREQHGGIHEFDFNLSFNFNNSLYAGLTMGVYDVDWNSHLFYKEGIADGTGKMHDYFMTNDEAINGNGFDLKLGVILRPIKKSPFRIGLAFSTPTWYSLTGNNILWMNSPFVAAGSTKKETQAGYRTGDFDYNIRTPWKLNVNVATTVANRLALDAEYEYKHLPAASVRFASYTPDIYGGSWSSSYRDAAIDNQIDTWLRGQHTLRLGAEMRLDANFSARAGYNYVSSPFKDGAFLNLHPNAGTSYKDSKSLFNATGTDYVNIGGTNRFTLGLGYHNKSFYADLAYQYQQRSTTVYPFHDTKEYTSDVQIVADHGVQGQKLKNIQNRLMLTIGWKF